MALIKRIVSSLARANPDHIVYGYNEDLTVSDPPRARAVHYRVNNLLNVAVRYDHHQLNFWEQVYLVLSFAVYLYKSFLSAPTFHLCDRHAMMSDLIERVFHYVKLGGPHYCDYFLHMCLGSSRGSICVTSAPPPVGFCLLEVLRDLVVGRQIKPLRFLVRTYTQANC